MAAKKRDKKKWIYDPYTELMELLKPGEKVFVAKKGKKYIGIRSNELYKTTILSKAIGARSAKDLEEWIDWAIIDTRNAEVIGASFDIVWATKK